MSQLGVVLDFRRFYARLREARDALHSIGGTQHVDPGAHGWSTASPGTCALCRAEALVRDALAEVEALGEALFVSVLTSVGHTELPARPPSPYTPRPSPPPDHY